MLMLCKAHRSACQIVAPRPEPRDLEFVLGLARPKHRWSRFNANGMIVNPKNRLVGYMSFGDISRRSISSPALISATEKDAVDPLIARIIWENMLFEFMGKERLECRL
ncbi:uncharacterized protein N7479_003706 [Penicillium vulpinum]|uniref:uncharacterized protein n=1 Tax=Penicillium vulpinum TaxID=29845 RepID=UPI002547F12C|nr:uncharacterized protein N7479_003706 [Penicillium vulpinum]KAJ5963830.1 hypothetical protein N7479_003706 [Penicillium vulpinum]